MNGRSYATLTVEEQDLYKGLGHKIKDYHNYVGGLSK